MAENHPGMAKLASVLDRRMSQRAQTDPVLDFGEVRPDGSLVLNTCQVPIPKGEYLICRGLTLTDDEEVSTSSISVGDHGTHSHTVNLARTGHKRLAVGDRVLVAWVGSEAVIIDIIIGSMEVI